MTSQPSDDSETEGAVPVSHRVINRRVAPTNSWADLTGFDVRPVRGGFGRQVSAIVAVATGGALGAVGRNEVWRYWPDDAVFPFTTLAINVLGCFAFGLIVGATSRQESGIARTFLLFGVLSGFTTFTFFAVQGVTLSSSALGALYLISTPFAAIACATFGFAVARVGLRVCSSAQDESAL